MLIRVNIDTAKVKADLQGVFEREIPFAIAQALTWTAQEAKEAVKVEMGKVFDRPTPFTLNSLYVSPAKKANLQAEVLIKDEAQKGTPAFKYLRAQIEGGPRNQKRSERALSWAGKLPPGMQTVPGAAAPLDQYGNVKRGMHTRMLTAVGGMGTDPTQNMTARSRGRRKMLFFVGRPGGGRLPLGIWQRTAEGIRPWLIFVSGVRYRKRLDYEGIVARVVETKFESNLEKSIEKTLSTSRGAV